MKLTDKLISELPHLDPIAFAAVSKILGVPLLDMQTQEPREFTDVLADVLRVFDKKDRKFKRSILKLLKDARKDAYNS